MYHHFYCEKCRLIIASGCEDPVGGTEVCPRCRHRLIRIRFYLSATKQMSLLPFISVPPSG